MDSLKTMLLTKEVECVTCTTTKDIKATYYVLQDGTQISFGYEYGGRTEDHRVMFSMFDDIEYNDFGKLLEATGMIGYAPENNTAWCLKNQILTSEQEAFIKRYNIELLTDEI